MQPPLSIIIPHFNHKRSLPRLLTSIQQQTLKDLEVIVVDDYSDESCADVVEAFAGQGLNIRLIQNEKRLYTLHTRLTGLRQAEAESVMFADADDMLWGTEPLGKHVALLHENDADLVHFRSVCTDENGAFIRYFYEGDPFAPTLTGANLFANFVHAQHLSGVLWNKIISRSFLLSLLPNLAKIPSLLQLEDQWLSSCLYAHAQKYTGSETAGYAHHFHNNHESKGLIRTVEVYILLQDLVPFLEKRLHDKKLARKYRKCLLNCIGLFAGHAGINAASPDTGKIDDASLKAVLKLYDSETIIKALLAGAMVNGSKLRAISRTALGLDLPLPTRAAQWTGEQHE